MLSNYADDKYREYINKNKDALAKDFEMVTNWFYKNFIVLSSKKFHTMCISRDG